MAVQVTAAKASGFSEQWIKNWARKTGRLLRRSNDDIAVVFVGKAKIKALNKRYRAIDKVTDVLSFPAGEKGDLGDIFIAPAVARARAAARGSSYKDHLALLIVHSVLHLAGYDHHAEADSRAMAKMEKKILSSF